MKIRGQHCSSQQTIANKLLPGAPGVGADGFRPLQVRRETVEGERTCARKVLLATPGEGAGFVGKKVSKDDWPVADEVGWQLHRILMHTGTLLNASSKNQQDLRLSLTAHIARNMKAKQMHQRTVGLKGGNSLLSSS